MRVLRDDRGQAIQVGAVLIFGFLVLFLAIYQAQVVPNENKQIEADHSDTVRTQLIQLRNAILQGAATGEGYPVTITLGSDYPARIFAVNPPPATGSLKTTAIGTVTLDNATAFDAETQDYLDGSELNFSTRGFVYQPDYAEYSAPRTVYGSTVLYTMSGNQFVEGLTNQSIISGNTISLVLVSGNLSLTGMQTQTVDPTVVSSSTTVTVQNQGSTNLTITLPSNLSVQQWEAQLPDDVSVSTEGGRIKLNLGQGIYRLRIAKISFGGNPEYPNSHYLTLGDGAGASVPEGGTQTVEFVVRDRFNNPVTGQKVEVSLNSSLANDYISNGSTTTDTTVSVWTNADGEAVVTYHAPSNVNGTSDIDLNATIPSIVANSSSRGSANTTLTVLNTDGSSGGDGGPEADQISVSNARTGSSNSIVKFDVTNNGTSDKNLVEVAVINTTDTQADRISDAQTILVDTQSVYSQDFDIGSGPQDITDSTIQSGSTVTLTIKEFGWLTPGGSFNARDMSGDDIWLTLYFADGTQTTVMITP